MAETKKPIETVSEEMSRLGSFGGTITFKRHGREHYRRMALKAWENRRKRQGLTNKQA